MTKREMKLRTEAKQIMWEYYKNNKSRLPSSIRLFREEILAGLLKGREVEVVFTEVSEMCSG